jgi:hypothetical protein
MESIDPDVHNLMQTGRSFLNKKTPSASARNLFMVYASPFHGNVCFRVWHEMNRRPFGYRARVYPWIYHVERKDFAETPKSTALCAI